MEFKRLNKNSQLKFIYLSPDNKLDSFIDVNEIVEDGVLLQMVGIESLHQIVLEILPREAQEQSTSSFERDIEFDNALDTIINNDPFGAKYSGKPIRCIFENGDNEWLDKALNLMHNEFIRKKLEYIVARGGYGKIKR